MTKNQAQELEGVLLAMMDTGRLPNIGMHSVCMFADEWIIMAFHHDDCDYFTSKEIRMLDSAASVTGTDWDVEPNVDGTKVEVRFT